MIEPIPVQMTATPTDSVLINKLNQVISDVNRFLPIHRRKEKMSTEVKIQRKKTWIVNHRDNNHTRYVCFDCCINYVSKNMTVCVKCGKETTKIY